jgi:SulP family sulfate permease
VGFTSGIALLIFSSQIKDFLGLEMGVIPPDFIDKWVIYFSNVNTTDFYSLIIGVSTICIILFWPRITSKIPGSLIAILVTTVATQLLHLPVETIGSRFGSLSSSLPLPTIPKIEWETIKVLIQPAITIAILGGIESLLSAVVADGMIRGNHKSNTELIAQGAANIGSALFGGIPATGAIARTVTNINNGGRTPIAGIIHSITLLLILLFFVHLAVMIPMPTLSGILIVVAYNMSEWKNFRSVLKGPKSDIAVLLTTFSLTVLIDLTIAIEVGMVLAAFLFMRKMIQFSSVNVSAFDGTDERTEDSRPDYNNLPAHCDVFEISGPLFFGAAYKFKDAVKINKLPPSFLILRMGKVPIIDATGIRVLKEVYTDAKSNGTKLILSEVTSPQVLNELKRSRLMFSIGKSNITTTFDGAIKRARK